MRIAKDTPNYSDDLDFKGLVSALEANIRQLRQKSDTPNDLEFGPRRIPKEEYAQALEMLLAKARADETGETFRQALRESFETYEVYGQEEWGQVFITSYFEPVVEGALKKSGRFTQPLFGTPKDLIVVDLKTFGVVPEGLEQKARESLLRGRLVPAKGKEDLPRVTIYPDRAAIDSGEIEKQAPVLAWVDPVDAFFLEIQGSGVVKLKGGKELKVGYAAQNGHPYVPIGRHMTDVIPKEKITLQAIENHLRQTTPEDSRRLMQLNPSYVFFRPLQSAGLTFFGTEVVAGRTIATDYTYFPKGALAFLQFEKPVFAGPTDLEPQSWQPTSRFVFDQDTGGAIRGPHRVDLFWGKGPAAKQSAGVMKNKGRLVYLVPKPQAIPSVGTGAKSSL